jgi:hypothetical protein
MSKAEIIHQLETLTREELDEVAERVDALRFADDDDELSPEHRAILEERLANFKGTPEEGEDVEVVVARIMNSFKK